MLQHPACFLAFAASPFSEGCQHPSTEQGLALNLPILCVLLLSLMTVELTTLKDILNS